METFSALLAICAGNSPVNGKFPAQRPVTRRFDDFFDLRLNTRLSKQWWGRWFETPSRPLWRHCNDVMVWQVFPHDWPFVYGIHRHLSQRDPWRGAWMYCAVADPSKLFNKQSSCRWFETPYDVIATDMRYIPYVHGCVALCFAVVLWLRAPLSNID